MKVAVLISGRGSNLKSILEAEKNELLGKAKVELVISDNSNAAGLLFAQKHNKKSVVLDFKEFSTKLEFEKKLIALLDSAEIDLIVLAGFMRILSSEFIDNFKNNIINIHPSLLPSFPGLRAQKQALEHGVKVSGCTVHFVNEEVDGGPIILQKAVELEEGETEYSLSSKILFWEHILLPKAIGLLSENRVLLQNNKVKVV